jgi:ATP-dependent exoDNAse (exonuclease V) alpha subunit
MKRFYFKAVWSPHDELELSASRFSRPTVDCPGMGAASDSGDVTVLKVGALVMLTTNMKSSRPYLVNGSRGNVLSFVTTKTALDWITKTVISEDDAAFKDKLFFQLEFLKSFQDDNRKHFVVENSDISSNNLSPSPSSQSAGSDFSQDILQDDTASARDELWPLVEFENGFRLIVLPSKGQVYEWKTVGERFSPVSYETNLPLRLAWALTIHKSQGLTIENLHVDFKSSLVPARFIQHCLE